ncbi:endolytic transglycosylase MltG [Arthrobacter sp. ISL-48]|uniref:endolytic transglycosylase MltG n=1 Tax=Arthrobacter sp. ISL-48 TaxID=2819110 RepID=UPI001BE74AD4|nr:endolytic transglycosylase MltG [Arthrobacter sp. ISL-48]MBT2531451.1 endolytic transglycosylase MltG [Arthrobacter sp. ISL-48]
MSPANNDDSSGSPDSGAARPLTRKELRAREKSRHTESNSLVPEQAYETGDDFPMTAAEASPAGTAASSIPTAPDTPPSIQAAEPAYVGRGVHEHTAHEEAHAPNRYETLHHQPLHQEPVHHEPLHQEPVHHEEPAPEDIYHHDADLGQDHHEGLHVDGASYEIEHGGPYYDGAHPLEDHHPEDHHPHDAGLFTGASAASVVRGPSKKVRRRRRFLALVLTLAVFVTAVAVGAQFLKPLLGNDKASDYPGPGTGEVQVTVQAGEGPRAVATALESGKVVANADTFLQAFTASGGTLAPGDYTFKMEMKNADAVNVLLGKDKSKVIYFALSAGLRIGESLEAISEGSGVPLAQLKALSDSPGQFGVPAAAKNLEGFLAPGEYRFPLGTPAKDILQSLVKSTLDELVSQGITDPTKQYEALIVASIVQAEGGQADYGDVAGAIYNRLKPNDQTGGFLQVDSAVTYGLGTRSFNFTDAEREDKSNPYNTYANPGLPPGPIGSPGKTAIDAAAKPKANDYLFWVTINLDTKETKFSKTLAEHNTYVAQYNSWCQAHTGRCS